MFDRATANIPQSKQGALKNKRARLFKARLLVRASIMGVAVFGNLMTAGLGLGAITTWDANTGTTGAQDGTGTWTTGSGGWWNGTSNVNWTAGDTATFGAGTDGAYNITVGGAITTGNGTTTLAGLNFLNSGYTLSAAAAQSVTIGSGTGFLTVASGKSATIGTNVTVQTAANQTMNIQGGGTLNVVGSGAKISINNNNLFINSGTSIVVGNSGLVTSSSQVVLGQTGNGNLTVNGTNAAVTMTATSGQRNLVVGNSSGSTCTLTLTNGIISNAAPGASGTLAGLRFGGTTAGLVSTGTFNLDGGSATFARVYLGNTSATGIFNFNGGTLKVLANPFDPTNYMTGLTTAQIRNGGAVIDSNGQSITIAQVLTHSAIGGDAATDGGFTLNDSAAVKGTLTLSGASTYTGNVNVLAGTLNLANATSTIPDASAVTVNGGTLNLTNSDTVGSVTLTSGTISGAGTLTGSSYSVSSGTISAPLGGSGVALTKSTAGTVTLSAASSSYTGATAINAGTLIINSALAGDVNVSANATLSGEGSAAGTLTFASGTSSILFDPTTVGGAFTAANVGVTGATVLISPTGATSNGTPYAVLKLSSGTFTGSPTDHFVAASRGTLAFVAGNTELDLTPTGAGSISWKGNDGTNPTFWDTTATVNWDNGGSPDRFYTSDTVTFDDTASSFSVAVQGSVGPAAVNFTNATNAYTISGGGIIGAATVNKSGAATATLSNVNTYTGATTVNSGTLNISGSILTSAVQINGGTLQVSNGNALADTAVVPLADAAGATFQVSTSETIGALTGGGTTGGNVSVDAGQTLTLSSGTQTFAGTVSGAGRVVSAGAVQTLSGPITGSGGIAVNSGILRIAGASNTYTGQTNVAAGAGILVSADGALGATGTGNEVVIGGAGNANSGAIGLTGGINYTSTKKVVGGGLGNTVANGVFASVQRGIVQSVSGNNTFAGNIELNSAGVSRFGTQNGAQLTLTGTITSTALNTQVLFRAGDTTGDFITLSSTGNAWALDTVIFTGNATFAGLKLGANNALPTTVGVVAGGNTAGAGNSLDLNGFNQTLNGLNASNGTLHIVNSTAIPSILTLNPDADKNTASATNQTVIEDGTGTGTVSLVKIGTFQQILAGTNNYTGTTSIQVGSLVFNKPGALYNANTSNWTASKIIVDSGATLGVTVGAATEFLAADVATLLSGLSTVSNNGLKAGSNFMMNATTAFTYSNIIGDSTGPGGGAVGLSKTGAGTLTLDQPNTFSGGFFLKANAVTVANNSALGTGTVTFGAAATRINLNNGINLANPINVNAAFTGVAFNGLIQNSNAAAGETVTLSGPITISALPTNGGHFASQGVGSILNVTGAITSSVKWTQRTGTVVYSGGGSYTDTGITGTAMLGANNGLATNATLDLGLSGNATLDLAGFNQSLAGITKNTFGATVGNSSTTADSTLTLTGSPTFAGVIQDVVGAGTRKVNVALNGVGQTVTLSGANTYSGATSVNAGKLNITGSYAAITPGTDAASVASGAELSVAGTATFATVTSPASTLSIGGTLNVNGAGTSSVKQFSGAGTLNITNGKLEIADQTPAPITYASDINTLSITSNGVLDVKNNAVQVRSADTTDAARDARWAQVLTGQNNFDNNGQVTWDGPGIVSSSARTNNVGLGVDAFVVGVISNHDLAKLSADGGAALAYDNTNPWLGTVSGVGADDILIRMTYAGDTNLDGQVTIDDYNNIDGTFTGLLPTNYGWVSGDFDFNGAITIDDYNAIDSGFLYQGGQLTQGMIAARTAMFGADYVAHLETVAAAFASVPEPTTVGMLAVGAMGLLARRRRKN